MSVVTADVSHDGRVSSITSPAAPPPTPVAGGPRSATIRGGYFQV